MLARVPFDEEGHDAIAERRRERQAPFKDDAVGSAPAQRDDRTGVETAATRPLHRLFDPVDARRPPGGAACSESGPMISRYDDGPSAMSALRVPPPGWLPPGVAMIPHSAARNATEASMSGVA